jgi:hypothetical protein
LTGGEEEKGEPSKRKSILADSISNISEGIASAFMGGEEKKERDRPRFSLSSVDNLLPRIRRGFVGDEEKEDKMVVGWKAEIKSRKEREEVLR